MSLRGGFSDEAIPNAVMEIASDTSLALTECVSSWNEDKIIGISKKFE